MHKVCYYIFINKANNINNVQQHPFMVEHFYYYSLLVVKVYCLINSLLVVKVYCWINSLLVVKVYCWINSLL